jgi:adenosylcobalamin-dependent ribonucleoside-triphosphate reductase
VESIIPLEVKDVYCLTVDESGDFTLSGSIATGNCAAISTADLSTSSVYEAILPFVRLMEMSAYGIGVGFDTRGAGKLTIHTPLDSEETFVVPDSREGWAESVGKLLESYFFKSRPRLVFDYSLVRPAGSPLRRFGGTASGPGPLIKLHASIEAQFAGREGEKITSRDIVDIMNKIGKAIQAGGARRSAELALGSHDDLDYINLKNWELPENSERTGADGWAWNSNNSVYADASDDLSHIIPAIAVNGEPGIIFLDNMQKYGRLRDELNMKDARANLVNPCAEISLESHELCNLAELYPTRHESVADLIKTMKHAYMFTKAVTLLPTPWAETNEVVGRNRRIGISMTGIAEFVETRGWSMMEKWMNASYHYLIELDETYSEWLGIRESIKVSTVKPSGTTSLIASTTPGVHWPTTSGYFIRRVRYAIFDPMVNVLRDAGYEVEPDVNDPENTLVVSFPSHGVEVRSERDVSIWEKAHLAVMAQRSWADNMVSVTVSFTKDEANQIAPLLNALSGQLKSISFLPIDDSGTTYAQAPFEPISEEAFNVMTANIKPLGEFYSSGIEAQGEKFCANDSCDLPFAKD